MKNSEHLERWKTAGILLIIIALVGIVDIPLLTWLFFGIVYLASFWEAMKLFGVYDKLLWFYAGILWILTFFFPHPTDFIFLILIIQGSILAYKRELDIRSFFPLLYPTAGILFLWMLYREYGMISMLWILAIVALTDVGAYYTGKKIGKTPFSPTSPKKTLEGVIGGVLAGTIGGTLLITGHKEIFLSAILIALFTSLASVFGDLFESYLKREAGVKDSGDILPGHGGVLDRIDGYLFASIALYILLKLVGA